MIGQVAPFIRRTGDQILALLGHTNTPAPTLPAPATVSATANSPPLVPLVSAAMRIKIPGPTALSSSSEPTTGATTGPATTTISGMATAGVSSVLQPIRPLTPFLTTAATVVGSPASRVDTIREALRSQHILRHVERGGAEPPTSRWILWRWNASIYMAQDQTPGRTGTVADLFYNIAHTLSRSVNELSFYELKAGTHVCEWSKESRDYWRKCPLSTVCGEIIVLSQPPSSSSSCLACTVRSRNAIYMLTLTIAIAVLLLSLVTFIPDLIRD